MNKHLKFLVERHYSSKARIDRRLFGGFRIVAPFGEVEINEEGFENIVGGGDMYRATLLFARERWGTVRVSGPAQHVMACMAHGKEMGIDVVPEGKKDDILISIVAITGLGFFWGMFFGLLLWPFLHDFLEAILYGGFMGAFVSGVLGKALIKKAYAKHARQVGQQYREIFPETYGSERRADREAARRKGLL